MEQIVEYRFLFFVRSLVNEISASDIRNKRSKRNDQMALKDLV